MKKRQLGTNTLEVRSEKPCYDQKPRRYFVFFSRGEADEKTGTWIRSRREFSGVPVGTLGLVTGIFEIGVGAFGLNITWVRRGRSQLTDGFSKDEYKDFLVEIREDDQRPMPDRALAYRDLR